MKTIISRLPNRTNFHKGRFTLNVGYPWITAGAIMALEEIVRPEFNVLEFGSGGSTIFFARRCKTIVSFEHDPSWAELVKGALPEDSNVTIFVGGVKRSLKIMGSDLAKSNYDIVFVDSGPTYGRRRIFLDNCGRFIQKGGYLVVDNYGMGPLRDFDYTDFEVYIFDSIRGYSGKGTLIGVRK
jgi:predicted O-methyltransferase YrrM